jgi:hypothetical protein
MRTGASPTPCVQEQVELAKERNERQLIETREWEEGNNSTGLAFLELLGSWMVVMVVLQCMVS